MCMCVYVYVCVGVSGELLFVSQLSGEGFLVCVQERPLCRIKLSFPPRSFI